MCMELQMLTSNRDNILTESPARRYTQHTFKRSVTPSDLFVTTHTTSELPIVYLHVLCFVTGHWKVNMKLLCKSNCQGIHTLYEETSLLERVRANYRKYAFLLISSWTLWDAAAVKAYNLLI